MLHENIKLVKTFAEYYNQKDIKAATALISDDFEWEIMNSGQKMLGKESLNQAWTGFFITFPDIAVNVNNIVDGGDKLVVEYDLTGTHKGPLPTPTGEIPATGKSFSVAGCEVYQIRNGKIASLHTYSDSAAMMQQLGLMPEPTS